MVCRRQMVHHKKRIMSTFQRLSFCFILYQPTFEEAKKVIWLIVSHFFTQKSFSNIFIMVHYSVLIDKDYFSNICISGQKLHCDMLLFLCSRLLDNLFLCLWIFQNMSLSICYKRFLSTKWGNQHITLSYHKVKSLSKLNIINGSSRN